VSTPGGDKPDFPNFDDFDLPTEGFSPADDAAPSDLPDLPDLTGDSQISSSGLLEEAVPTDLSAEEAPLTSGESVEDAAAASAIGLPSFTASEETAAGEAEDSKKNKKKSSKPKKEKKAGDGDREGFFQRLGKTSPYVVMLGLSFVVLVIAVTCLVMELASFNYDVKAKEAKQQAAVTSPLHSPPRTTTAV
jgi:type IV secretory pathway VirB10-like protein